MPRLTQESEDDPSAAVLPQAYRLLRVLAGYFVRHDLPWPEFERLGKKALVDAAKTFAQRGSGTTNFSKVAAATGLVRQEIARMLAIESEADVPRNRRPLPSRARTLVEAWASDPRFSSKPSGPRPLLVKGTSGTFEHLVACHGADVPPAAMLSRLLNLKMVRVTPASRERMRTVELLPRSAWLDESRATIARLEKIADLANAIAAATNPPNIQTVIVRQSDATELAAVERTLIAEAGTFVSSMRDTYSEHTSRPSRRVQVAVLTARLDDKSTAPSKRAGARTAATRSRKKKRISE